jgi:dUTP pyrophosphatase
MQRKHSKAVEVRVVRLAHGEDLPLPQYQSDGAAGLDLIAAVPAAKPLTIKARGRALVPTGLAFALPKGYEAQVRPRSGLALREGVTVLNSPGTIDSDYRGEVQVILVNLGTGPFTVKRGDRIAQLVIAPVTRADLVLASVLEQTARGGGGFGSTGRQSRKPAPRKR